MSEPTNDKDRQPDDAAGPSSPEPDEQTERIGRQSPADETVYNDPTAPVWADQTSVLPEQPREEPTPGSAPPVPPTAPGAPSPYGQQQSTPPSGAPSSGQPPVNPYAWSGETPPPPAGPGQSPYGEQPGQPPYGQQPGQPSYGQQQGQPFPGYGQPSGIAVGRPYGAVSGKANAVMWLGITAIVLTCLCGVGFVPSIVALALAPGAKREVEASGGALTGLSQIRTGQITAIIAIALLVIAVVVAVAIGLAGGFNSNIRTSYGASY